MDASAEATTSRGDRLLRARESGIFLFTVYLVLFLYWYTGETFWTAQNLLNVARNVSFVTIMGIRQALVVITGGIALSAGSVLGRGGMIAAVLLSQHGGLGIGVAGAIGAGPVAGLLNGRFVARVGMRR